MQIGSYFGSVLQTVDVDDDSYTDLLLVGAPMYMGSERNEQGQVYVYKLNPVQKTNKLGFVRFLQKVTPGRLCDAAADCLSSYPCVFSLCY